MLAAGLDAFNSAGGVTVALVVLLAALGTAAAVFKANRVQTTVKVLQDLSAALKEQNANQRAQIETLQATTEDQARQISDLKEMVQSRAAVEALAEKIDTNHTQVLRLLGERGVA